MTVKPTDCQLRVLQYLHRYGKCAPAYIGKVIVGDGIKYGRGRAQGYALLASGVLNKLHKAGLVGDSYSAENKRFWHITAAGRDALKIFPINQ